MATKKRRLNGDGSFRKRSNGTWEYRITIPNQYDKEGKAVRISAYGKTQSEARSKATAKINQYQTGTVYAPDTVTVTQLAYIICEEKLKDGTCQKQSYDRNVETVKRLSDIDFPIQRITTEQLRDFCNAQRHYSDSTIKKIHQLLNKVFDVALQKDIISKNPMLCVKMPKSSKPAVKVRALTIDEEKRLISALNNNEVEYKDAMLISLFTGLRMGEVLALQVGDIDRNIIHITKTISRGTSGAPFVNFKTKTDAGIRDIRINSDICAFLNSLADGRKPQEYLFTNNGNFVSTNSVNGKFAAALKQYDILDNIAGKKVTLHSLRHTYATRCIESGMQAKVLQHRLGHKDIQTTYNIYGDVFAMYEDACLDVADKYFEAIGVKLGYGNP